MRQRFCLQFRSHANLQPHPPPASRDFRQPTDINQQVTMSASLAPECNEVKERYDTCFLKWYSEKYLRSSGTDNNECADLFKNYQKCLTVALKERGIDKLLDEAREDQKDNDATYMGRK
ncbi:Mitochondrial distribution and morphology protein 35 [Colletotrichum tanaceti]|nr:Mitochondrial distribution and morphology protein 35 [Colletotrichum tanaceti]